ncbi:hypothetical protein UlMin_007119 [Ulmus minor]
MSGEGKVVCVTGASGYIASWLVKLLLERGYTVRASVRDPSQTEHLLSLDGAKERLHLVKANLLEEGSFDAVVDGCEGVFHMASPVSFFAADPQAELIDPAVKGTLNRVVITSSMATVRFNGKTMPPNEAIDETWFSDVVYCEKSELWYWVSKILAEEAAWKFAKENKIDVVTIHPGVVIGPLLQPTLNTSAELLLDHIKGAGCQAFPKEVLGFIDVRDVAYAHVQAFEIASANGRYCLVGCDGPPEPNYLVSKEKAKSLGLSFTPLEVSLRDTVESLMEKGFLIV